ncbi:hypothetical protein Pmani_029445 [Petrolisthes manimaculis]|uniref:Carbohydrate sulfotransferase n=1 Tax=Petrolisthes manimaculis TaxID=1843537 RepID=A0AAE1TUL4_9EUCA|nr:hypothetical protein Pmani_029445 [Petrolisthes manimaculis]
MSKEGQGKREEEAGVELPSDPTTLAEEKGGRGWLEVQGSRAMRVRRACSALNITQQLDEEILKHLLVDNKHKALYCFVPKVACTSWKRLWFLLSGKLKRNSRKGRRKGGIEDEFAAEGYEEDEDVSLLPRTIVHAPDSLPNLARYMGDEDTLNKMLKTYKKFVFVRHPLDRLVSAYRDKLEARDQLSTFDFHKNVLGEVKRMVRRREYDAIGKYEHLQEEMNATLHWLGAGEYSQRFPAPDRPSFAASHRSTYLRLLSSGHRIRLLRTYLLDFLLFGYSMP